MKKLLLIAAAVTIALLSPAQARHHHVAKIRHHHHLVAKATCTPSFFNWCSDAPKQAVQAVYRVASTVGRVVGGRPSGCPHAYCGCGTSLHLFGRIIPSLNLAANWSRFPSAAPAPGMAAWRNGHVFAIDAVNPDGTVVAYDSNSGHGLTRIHNRSLAGYHVVNPNG